MFIGRKDELSKIRNKISSPNQENILVYGRRRIGKSYLVKEAVLESKDIIINYQCKRIAKEETLKELTNIIVSKLLIRDPVYFDSFDNLLEFLFNRKENIIFILDEYGYLHEKYEGIDSIIQSYIDKYKFESNLKIILLGSSIDIMENLLDFNNPLFGRFSLVINLQEQDYYESSMFYPNYSNEEKVMLYSVFGGEPYLNANINTNISAMENIINLVIEENSIGELFVIDILKNEIDKVNGSYDVLQRIALGDKKNDTIKNNAHVESTAALSLILNRLIKLGIIQKINPINDENNKKKTMYFLQSNIVSFYYRYVFRNISYRNNLSSYDFYDIFIREDFENMFIPSIFEKISKQYLIRNNKKNDSENKFFKIGTYWYDDKKSKTNGQFDIVTLDKSGYVFYEVKYKNKKVDDSIVNEEKYQLELLDLKYYNLGFISKSGFNFKTKNEFITYTLEDIYK